MSSLKTYWRDTRRAVSVAWMLAIREWAADVRQSRLSLLWPIAQPLAYTFLFVVLRPVIGMAKYTEPAAFAVFVFIGFTLWQSWFEVLRAQMEALRKHKGLMSRGELSIAMLVLATTFSACIQLMPRLFVAAVAAVALLDASPLAILGLVGFSLLVLANGSVLGALLQPFATLSPDLGKTIQSFSLALMMSGAVFIPVPHDPSPMIKVAFAANPMGTLLNAARGPLFHEATLSPDMLLFWIIFTIAVAVFIPVLGRRVLPIVVERLGG